MTRQIFLVAASLLAAACLPPLHAATDPGSRDGRPHLEACAEWSEQNGSFGFKNTCGEPMAILFVGLSGAHRFDRVVGPGDRFDTGVHEKDIDDDGWLFAACPAGYLPSVPFTYENKNAILKGLYQCVRK